MRTTFNTTYRDGAAGIAAAHERMIDAQRQVSTGRRINRISDDPTGASNVVAERNALAAVEQYTSSTDSVGSRLTVIDTVLDDVLTKLTRAQEVAMAGQGSAKTQIQREAAAQELRGLREAVLDNLNSTFHGAFLFSGASATTKPFQPGGGGVINPYAGSASENEVDIGDGRSVKVTLDGNTIAQGGAAQHVFDSFDDLIAAVVGGNDAAISTGIQELKAAFDRTSRLQGAIGSDMQEIDGQKLRLQQMKLSTDERLSKLEAANIAEAISNMSQADTAYQAALGAVSTATRVSLLDYLK
jgi:flagellar hook-associated protein 3 FlgL